MSKPQVEVEGWQNRRKWRRFEGELFNARAYILYMVTL